MTDAKSLLVTGGGRGIGAAVARLAAAAGYRVAINFAKNEAAASKMADDIDANSGEAFVIKGDVGSEKDGRGGHSRQRRPPRHDRHRHPRFGRPARPSGPGGSAHPDEAAGRGGGDRSHRPLPALGGVILYNGRYTGREWRPLTA